MVNGACHEFFSRATFAGYQNGSLARGDLSHYGKYLLHLRRCPDHVDQHARVGQLPLEAFGFFSKAALRSCTLEQRTQCTRLNRLFEKPEGPQIMNGLNGSLDVAESRKHNGGYRRAIRA